MADQDDVSLQTLIAHDEDDFVRWDAMQHFATEVIRGAMNGREVPEEFLSAFRGVLESPMDLAMKSMLLSLPSEEYLTDHFAQSGPVNALNLHEARQAVKKILAQAFRDEWQQLFDSEQRQGAYAARGEQIGQRALRHLALDYLMYSDHPPVSRALALLQSADNLTDRLAALRAICKADDDTRRTTLGKFFATWQHEALVVNQWFSLQATRLSTDSVEDVASLTEHQAFDWRNPNKVRALVGAFASANPVGFHRADGAGYRLLADAVIKLQEDNPQIAARLCVPLTRFRRYAAGQTSMREQLERIAAVENLSRDVFEVVQRSLSEAD
jgi:aminopeptidase N